MANPFQVAGADKTKPTPYAAIYTDRCFTGLWTQRSPLRDAATPYLYEKFYAAARYDSLLGGVNVELTNRLTLKRRPGHSVYNSYSFSPANRAYEFRTINNAGQQVIRVMLDTASVVYDATPAVIGGSSGVNVWTKSGTGSTQFQGVGNILYAGDGAEQLKWVYLTPWQANYSGYAVGQTIRDGNNNLQQITAVQTMHFTEVQVSTNVLTLTVSIPWSFTQLTSLPGQQILLQNFTTATFLNGQTVTITALQNPLGGPYTLTASFTHANYGPTADNGGVYSSTAGATGASGSGTPSWGNTIGALTLDGSLQWTCKGPSVQNWGGAGPPTAPTVANTQGGAIAPAWAASTFYSPTLILLDSNSNIQLLTTAGTTGGSAPAWNVTTGGTTPDNTAVWTNQGPAAWPSLTAVNAGQYIAANWSVQVLKGYAKVGGSFVPVYITYYYFDFFVCVKAGTTGGTQPAWASGLGSQVSDGSAVWQNAGMVITWPGGTQHSVATIAVGASTAVSLTKQIVDANNNLENVYQAGKSGGTAPSWATTQGALTNDGSTLQWSNAGPSPSKPNVGTWYYGFAFRNSVTDYDTPMSPASAGIVLTPPAGFTGYITVTGNCPSDPQFDTIRIFRTSQQVGGGVPVYEQLFDLPLTGSQIGNSATTWSFADTYTDAQLNFLILGDTVGQNSPPPSGFVPDCYHLGRIWGHVGGVVYYSNGPDALNGIGPNETFSPVNNFVMPSPVVRSIANALGLFILTTSGMYTVPGSGTASDPIQLPRPFLDGKTAGLLNFDALAINGTLIYMMNSKNEVLMIDPSSGVTEAGFPIGDILLNYYNAGSTRVIWHDQNSTDAALYVADGTAGWFRCNPTPAPETGIVWSPQAQPVGGAGFVQSVEVATGVHKLLVQAPGGGPLLFRDPTTFQDNGTSYAGNAIIGSLVLAHGGSVALVDFLTVDAIATGSRIVPGVLIDEISGAFETLSGNVPDPTYLAASSTTYNDRWYLSTTQEPALCRHLQIQFSWAAENFGNELLAYSIFGAVVPEL